MTTAQRYRDAGSDWEGTELEFEVFLDEVERAGVPRSFAVMYDQDTHRFHVRYALGGDGSAAYAP